MFPIPRRWSLTLASTIAAALMTACGGGSEPGSGVASAPAALKAAVVEPTAAASDALAEIASAPVDGDRVNRGSSARATKAYIVQLAEMPVSAYDGGIQGLQATKPRKGQKLNPNSPAVANYLAHLTGRHDTVLRGVGNARKLYSYGYVFNGFAAELTDAQAQKLAATKGVLAVSKDEIRTLDTATTPNFLGLSGPTGFWQSTGAKGEGVVIGIVDSGIWPESESFSDRTGTNGNASKDGKLDYQQIPGWHGKCTPGDQFTGTDCNQKLIGARYYNAGWGGNAGITALFPE